MAALPRNLLEWKSNMEERRQYLMNFIVKAKLYFMASQQQSDLRILKEELEHTFYHTGTLVGFQHCAVQAFFAATNINLAYECAILQTPFWYGKFQDENSRVFLYVCILGLPN